MFFLSWRGNKKTLEDVLYAYHACIGIGIYQYLHSKIEGVPTSRCDSQSIIAVLVNIKICEVKMCFSEVCTCHYKYIYSLRESICFFELVSLHIHSTGELSEQ